MAQRKKPARKSSASRSRAKSQSPSGRMWLIACFAILAFIGLLIFLKQHQQPTPKAHWLNQAIKEHSAQHKAAPPPKFEFYTLLPSSKTRIPPAATVTHKGTPTAPVESLTKAPPTQEITLLQVASFKNMNDANALKTKLARQGLNPHIEKMTNNGAIWYRVLVGPFKDAPSLAIAQKQLRNENLDSIKATFTLSTPPPLPPVIRASPLKSG